MCKELQPTYKNQLQNAAGFYIVLMRYGDDF